MNASKTYTADQRGTATCPTLRCGRLSESRPRRARAGKPCDEITEHLLQLKLKVHLPLSRGKIHSLVVQRVRIGARVGEITGSPTAESRLPCFWRQTPTLRERRRVAPWRA